MALIDTINSCRKISLIGLAKNTGKTVALQILLKELEEKDTMYGLTSIGHDGEEFDQTNVLIKKPRVRVSEGALVATTEKLFQLSTVKYELLLSTRFSTPLGIVQIGRIRSEGIIEIAGPSTASGVNEVAEIMLGMGAKIVLIDGAINRKAISSHALSDGVIIATGAALNASLDAVIEETRNAVSCFTLPNHVEINDYCNHNQYGITLFDSKGAIKYSFNSLLVERASFLRAITKKEINCIISYSSVVESLLNEIVTIIIKHDRKITLMLSDHTKLFLENRNVLYYEKRGLTIRVMTPSNILAVTVNPVSPLSHSFDSDLLVSGIKSKLPGLPVYDVLSPGYH